MAVGGYVESKVGQTGTKEKEQSPGIDRNPNVYVYSNIVTTRLAAGLEFISVFDVLMLQNGRDDGTS